ncbi:hypothetical protein HBI59_193460, partial [Parastagonospora nodorum]
MSKRIVGSLVGNAPPLRMEELSPITEARNAQCTNHEVVEFLQATRRLDSTHTRIRAHLAHRMDRLSYPEVQVALRLEVEECLWELEEEEETPRGVEEETLRGVEEETLKDVEEEALLTELEV